METTLRAPEDGAPYWDDLRQKLFRNPLKFVVAEDVVLVAAGALRAFQAADKEHCHAHRNQDGEDVYVRRKPLNQAIHARRPYPATIQNSAVN